MRKKKTSKLYLWQERARNPLPEDKCAKCGQGHHLTVDHIVPVSWLQQFIPLDKTDQAIYEMEENFELLCYYCNRFKGNSIDPRNPRVYEVLEKVITQAKIDHL